MTLAFAECRSSAALALTIDCVVQPAGHVAAATRDTLNAVGLTDRRSAIRFAHSPEAYPVGRTGRFRGENRRDSWLSRGENRLNY